ncbi:AAA family ATPase [Halobacteriales archaeon SW_7_68_16]|nr:MAG: AAA family ATPase [Halobacteriales archaeon SW_7_68_16]
MQLRGDVVETTDRGTVSTPAGDRTAGTVVLRLDDPVEEASTVRVRLWADWAETADLVEPGMELLVTDVERLDVSGPTFGTTDDSAVVVEPDFLVRVTAIREWVQCPRQYYLDKFSPGTLAYPLVKGTIVHEVFGDLLRGRSLAEAAEERVAEAGIDVGLLGRDPDEVIEDAVQNARAIETWLDQGRLADDDWRSERLLISDTYGIRGRVDAIRNDTPVELKTGKNLNSDPRPEDKVQAAAYGLLLRERGVPVDTGTLLYTKNAALSEEELADGDGSPAKDFTIGAGVLHRVLAARNEIAAAEHDRTVPTGYEADAICKYCFVRDTCKVVAGKLDEESKAGGVGRPLPEEERDYFRRWYSAIEGERRAIHREFRKLWEQTATERVEADRAIIGLEPTGTERLSDGRYRLTADRSNDTVSKLREGDLALASDGDPTGDAELVRIERLTDGAVAVTSDESVPLRRLDVYPTESTAQRLLAGLHDGVLAGDGDRKDVLFERRAPAFGDPPAETFVGNNPAQDRAVNLAVSAKDCALIHGPPGTGKTYTIARAIRALVERGERVLLSAFTNRAVDNAVEALIEQGFEDVVRVGTEHGVRSDMQAYRLDPDDPTTGAERLREAPVVAATTATCASARIRTCAFDVAVVDEAAQLTEPGTLLATERADRFVLVGDHHQLPPVTRSDGDLVASLFERLVEAYPDAGVMLDRQYRMAQRVQAFPSREFYDGALRPATGSVAGRDLSDLDGVDPDALPVELDRRVTMLDVGGDDAAHTDAVEAERVAEVVAAHEAAGLDRDDIGVIAPFRAQVAEIDRRVPEGVTVDTVDRFQGSSEEVIIVSFVATDELTGPIFEDYRRVNVALTRAKRALVLVGDADALRSDDLYGRMVDWAQVDTPRPR